MTNINVIENKISSVRKYLKALEEYRGYSLQEIQNNPTLKGAVERYLYLMTQAAIDLAEAVIAFQDFRKPTTLTEAFHILNEEKIISNNLTEKMVKMVGFRNAMAHDYEKFNFDIAYDVLRNKFIDVEEFIQQVKSRFGL